MSAELAPSGRSALEQAFRALECRNVDPLLTAVTVRFRPNILVEPADQVPFVEDCWVGCMLRVGGMSVRVDKRDGRCAVITIDPLTTERTRQSCAP